MIVRRFCLAAAALAVLAAPVAAQGGRVEISTSPEIPIANRAAEATVQFLDTRPQAASLFIRAVGEIPFREQVGIDQGGGIWTVQIADIPASGLEVYAQFELDGQTITEPLQSPELFPIRVPSILLSLSSDVPLPARQYRMVSVPAQLGLVPGVSVTLGSDAPIDVFGDDFGPTGDPAQWRLLRWDPLMLDYRDAIRDGELFERVRPGAGYWLITASGGTFDVDQGLSTGVVFDGGPFPADVLIPVRSGWNQIGNPFLFPIQWDAVGRPFRVEDPVAFTGAFVGGQTTLQPWEGYFVFNPGSPGQLRFSASPLENSGERTLAERLRECAGAGAATLQVTALSGTLTDEVTLGVGAAERAPDAPPIDLRKPPAVDDGLRIAVVAEGEDWISHFRPREASAWTLAVTAPNGSAVDLRLDALGDWPDGLTIQDLDTGEALDVVGDRVRVPGLRGVATRRLAVRAGATVDAPEDAAPRLGTPRPNPSAGPVTLPLVRAVPGPARLDVVDALGRTVRSLALDLPADAQTVSWDGLDASGQPVAAGVYLVRLATEAGTAAARVTRLR